jgi:hypothetical protein
MISLCLFKFSLLLHTHHPIARPGDDSLLPGLIFISSIISLGGYRDRAIEARRSSNS